MDIALPYVSNEITVAFDITSYSLNFLSESNMYAFMNLRIELELDPGKFPFSLVMNSLWLFIVSRVLLHRRLNEAPV